MHLGLNDDPDDDHVYLRVTQAENLDKTSPFRKSSPYAVVHFGGRRLGATPVERETVYPQWRRDNVFKVQIKPLSRLLSRPLY